VNWWWLTLPVPYFQNYLLSCFWAQSSSRKIKPGNLKDSTLENMQALSSEVRERLGMLSVSSKMVKDGENIHLILERDGEV
jgi:hypothetical protein